MRGEIIEVPSQILSVLDYLRDVDNGVDTMDSFSFDFNFFDLTSDNADSKYPYAYNPLTGELLYDSNSELIDKVRDTIKHTKNYKTNGSESTYFGYTLEDNYDDKLTSDEYSKRYSDLVEFNKYISNLNIDPTISNSEKRIAINKIFDKIKNLTHFLQYKMSETTNRHDYEILKNFYNAAYYSREVKSLFTINHGTNDKRTAKTFFEFLYYYNPKLYNILFTPNYEGQYENYKRNNPDTTYTLEDYKEHVIHGDIEDFTYSTLNEYNSDIKVSQELLYYYIDHVISKLKQYVDDLSLVHKVHGSASDLDKLLVKLIIYFKSFTVDVIGMDTIYIMDIKLENQMRFFDELNMDKDIDANDEIKLSFADHVKLNGTSYNGIPAGTTLYLNDKPKNHYMQDRLFLKYENN